MAVLISRSVLSVLSLAATVVTGCASVNAATATGSRATAAGIQGTWQGVITGRELAQSGHIVEVLVTLSIRADGTWQKSSLLGRSAGVVTSLAGDQLELDGRLHHAQGPPVWCRLRLGRGDTLMGLLHTHFSGATVVTGILLQRVHSPGYRRPRGPGSLRSSHDDFTSS